MKSKDKFKSINIKLDFEFNLDETNVYLNNASSIKITSIIESNVNSFKNINIG